MSATALKAAATGNVANNGQPKTLAHLMTDPKIKAQMALALPKHMTADRCESCSHGAGLISG
ncbi:hypothetical protein [Pseudomonas aeruginosa]|uniref:hypothetical protein n=1 Tax=Pseudomonas aeruginosa TaxID=287 RepID=UPI001F08B327|nr:hypothetical protein [Pseudomonas aeruginosa]